MSDDHTDELADIPDPFDGRLPAAKAPDVGAAPSPTRDDVRRSRRLLLIAAVAYEAMAVLAMGLRPDLAHVARGSLALALLLPLSAAGVAMSLATRGGRRAFALLFAPFLLFAASAAIPLGATATDALLRETAMCLVGSTMLAAGPLALAAYAYRHSFATGATRRTVAVGVACGALAAAAIELRCVTSGAAHVLIGHGAALVLGGLAALGLVRLTRA